MEASATVESFEIFVGRASGYETSTDYQKYLISGPQWQDAGNYTPGYEKDPNPVQTFSWDGKATPITLTFQNHRKPSILFVKRDAVTGETLSGAIIEVFHNGQKI